MSEPFSADTGKFNPSDKTFTELMMPGKYPWWENLKKNKNISIQIRKGNTIDAYYNGGGILKELHYDERKNKFVAKIHCNYILLGNDANGYQPLLLTTDSITFSREIKTMEFSQLEDKALKPVIARVKKYHNTESEKAIQFDFLKNDPFIIDAELQTAKYGRIDLVRLDKKTKKIVLIEVKTKDDPRLFADPNEDKKSVYHQLKKYHDFAVDNQKSILDYYAKLLQVKEDLGLNQPEVKRLISVDWKVECYPLLVFGDCGLAWTKEHGNSIDEKIQEVAYAAYYFAGSEYPLELDPESKTSRHFFQGPYQNNWKEKTSAK